MDSLSKLLVSISALIASLALGWIALTITDTIPDRHVAIYHDGSVELTSATGGFEIRHY